MAGKFSNSDTVFMDRALQLAERGMYTATPNPRVGCVIVKDGRIIGEGWHEKAGEPHAEVMALRSSVGAGSTPSNATAYVTLEPCSHFGRTPPCADALIAGAVSRVVVAMKDPNPLVAGSGIEKLRAAGIEVDCGLRAEQATELNIGFVTRMRCGRPWIRTKIACSLDGKTALANGQSQWITGAQARADGHRWRASSCAVLTGIGTVFDDNPRLTVRDAPYIQTPLRQPLRVIVDSDLRMPFDAAALASRALIACARIDSGRKAALESAGAEVVALPNAEGKVDLERLLQALAARGINEVLVEAGARLNGALLAAGLVDELLLYQAPVILGTDARGMFAGAALTVLNNASQWRIVERRILGTDSFFRTRRADESARRA